MFRFFLNQRRRSADRGFTLIELVVVLAILGILLALAVPRYLGARKRAYKAEIDHIMSELKTLSWAYYQEQDFFPVTASDLPLLMPSGAAWQSPIVSSGGGSSAWITWTASGQTSGFPVTQTDLCSLTLSGNGAAAQGCSF